jgi:hypothetical protein
MTRSWRRPASGSGPEETPKDALADVQERMQWKLDRVMRRWDAVGAERLAEWRAYDGW